MEVLIMPKQNFGSGLEKNGQPRQGEKGGKGGTQKKTGNSEFGGNKTRSRGGDTGEKTKGNPIGPRDSNTNKQGQF
jgi:hypothetical protein